ncbi:MAG: sugar phosphate isomerase/epimerase family protein [Planctomycetota bacterium]
MTLPVNRREFLQDSGVALAASALVVSAFAGAASSAFAQEAAAAPAVAFKKAVKLSMVEGATVLDKFKLIKECGFHGVDVDGPPLKHEEVLKARDETGLNIHGVVTHTHWSQPLSHPDPKVRENGLNGLLQAIKDSKAYGGTTVLLVVGVVNKDISYADAYTRTQEEIKKALPLATELGIKIAFENVWNMFLLSPLEFARYIDEFQSPQVGAYFDVGNVVNYGWPEQWIRTLGKRILKVDIKEYSRTLRDKKGPYAGFTAPLGEGDCDWPAVLKALGDVGITEAWGTAEVQGGGKERLTDISTRMDKILQIKKT